MYCRESAARTGPPLRPLLLLPATKSDSNSMTSEPRRTGDSNTSMGKSTKFSFKFNDIGFLPRLHPQVVTSHFDSLPSGLLEELLEACMSVKAPDDVIRYSQIACILKSLQLDKLCLWDFRTTARDFSLMMRKTRGKLKVPDTWYSIVPLQPSNAI